MFHLLLFTFGPNTGFHTQVSFYVISKLWIDYSTFLFAGLQNGRHQAVPFAVIWFQHSSCEEQHFMNGMESCRNACKQGSILTSHFQPCTPARDTNTTLQDELQEANCNSALLWATSHHPVMIIFIQQPTLLLSLHVSANYSRRQAMNEPMKYRTKSKQVPGYRYLISTLMQKKREIAKCQDTISTQNFASFINCIG